MSAYDVVLFLHILAAIFGFGVAAVAHATMFRLRSAGDVGEVRGHLRVLDKTGPLFPVAAVLLLALGGLLVHLSDSEEKWHWSNGWIVTAIVALIAVEVIGGLVIGRGVKGLERNVADMAGPVDAPTRSLLADKPIWLASHLNTAVIASGVLLMMTSKPSGLTSVVVVLVGAAIGLASAVPFAKPFVRA